MTISPIIHFFNFFLPLLYFGILCIYAVAFFRDLKWAKRIKTPLFVAVLGIHLLYLFLRTAAFGHPPVTSVYEIFTVLAFSISLAYLIIEFRSKVKETGLFIAFLVFLFQTVSSLFIKDLLVVREVLRSNLFGLHVSTALLGYAAITISAVFGFLYLMLYHEIRSNRFGVIYKKLPNLETLERMGYSGLKMSFFLLGLAIIIGFIWLPASGLDFSYLDPKLIGTILIWLLYGFGIIAKRRGGWKGRKVMLLTVWSFGITLFSMMVINLFLSGFHKFD